MWHTWHYENKCLNPTNPREKTSFSRVNKVHMSPKEIIKNYKCALCGKKGHRETQCPESRAFEDTMQKNLIHQKK